MTKLPPTSHRNKVILWLADNNGVLTRIARAMDVSQPFVSDVLYGRRTSVGRRVEQKLAAAGAPGFAEGGKR